MPSQLQVIGSHQLGKSSPARPEWTPEWLPSPFQPMHSALGQTRGADRHVGWNWGHLAHTRAGALMPVTLAWREGEQVWEVLAPTCYSKRSKPSSSGQQPRPAAFRARGCPATQRWVPGSISVLSLGNHVPAPQLNPGSACLPRPVSNSKDSLPGPRRRSYPVLTLGPEVFPRPHS